MNTHLVKKKMPRGTVLTHPHSGRLSLKHLKTDQTLVAFSTTKKKNRRYTKRVLNQNHPKSWSFPATHLFSFFPVGCHASLCFSGGATWPTCLTVSSVSVAIAPHKECVGFRTQRLSLVSSSPFRQAFVWKKVKKKNQGSLILIVLHEGFLEKYPKMCYSREYRSMFLVK